MKFSKTLVLLLALIAGCSSMTSDRHREGDNTGQKAALTVEEERKLTQEALSEMRKDYPPIQDKRLQAYIEKIGQKLVRANRLHNNPYTYNFTLVDVDQVNAFALPAGTIYMTLPILAMAETEAEIAGVLGHEIGHVTARHTAERMYVAKKEQPKMWGLAGVGAVLGGTAGYFLGNKLCDPKDTACKAKYAVYGAGGGAAGGLLVHKYGFMKNSREDEMESDRVGFRYAVNAGYDKKHIGDFFRKLLTMERKAKGGNNAVMGWLADAMSSHPPSQERVNQANELEAKYSSSSGIKTTPEFLEMKKLAQQLLKEGQQRRQAKR